MYSFAVLIVLIFLLGVLLWFLIGKAKLFYKIGKKAVEQKSIFEEPTQKNTNYYYGSTKPEDPKDGDLWFKEEQPHMDIFQRKNGKWEKLEEDGNQA